MLRHDLYDVENASELPPDAATMAYMVEASRTDVPIYDVVWPRSPRGVRHRALADRLPSLNGARIAFLWDHVFRGDEIFPALADELTTRFPNCEIVGYDEFGNTHGGDEAVVIAGLPDALARRHVDAVVSGMGC